MHMLLNSTANVNHNADQNLVSQIISIATKAAKCHEDAGEEVAHHRMCSSVENGLRWWWIINKDPLIRTGNKKHDANFSYFFLSIKSEFNSQVSE